MHVKWYTFLHARKNTAVRVLTISGTNVKKKTAAQDVCTPETYIVTACEQSFNNITKKGFQSLKRFKKVTYQEEINSRVDCWNVQTIL